MLIEIMLLCCSGVHGGTVALCMRSCKHLCQVCWDGPSKGRRRRVGSVLGLGRRRALQRQGSNLSHLPGGCGCDGGLYTMPAETGGPLVDRSSRSLCAGVDTILCECCVVCKHARFWSHFLSCLGLSSSYMGEALWQSQQRLVMPGATARCSTYIVMYYKCNVYCVSKRWILSLSCMLQLFAHRAAADW